MTPATALLSVALGLGPGPSDGSVRDVVFLADDRPVFLRLRVTTDGRPFDAAWPDSMKALHAALDRNGDGTLTTKEADKDALDGLVRLATGLAAVPPRGEPDARPKDGVVSPDELAEALRPALGPFRVRVGRLANGRTDALFDHLDRDKDGQLTRPELAAIAGSLRRLDLDDNEMISPDELEPFNNPAAMLQADTSDRRARFTAVPPVVELVAGESSLRPARLLLKKYDKGRPDAPTRPDNKLSPSEFAVDPDAFAAADANHDDALTTDELRRFLARSPVDVAVDIDFPPDAPAVTTARGGGGDDAALPKGVEVRRLADGDFEFSVGRVRLDLHVDDGGAAAGDARRVLTRRFKAADVNKDGYLDGKELAAENAAGAPLAGLTGLADRDGDAKLYEKEITDFVDRQAAAARGRLTLTVDDQGRAIFGILDLDRDRRLGAREILRTVDRVTSWDADGDGLVTADEIPYHFQVTLARGGLPGLTGAAGGAGAGAAAGPMAVAPRAGPDAGPDWFRGMDRNRDGDVSRREFLGPRDSFERLDRDKDGLIDPDEAGTAAAKPES